MYSRFCSVCGSPPVDIRFLCRFCSNSLWFPPVDILCSAKRLKLLMQPLASIQVRTEALLLTKLEVWWYLVIKLGPNLAAHFEQVRESSVVNAGLQSLGKCDCTIFMFYGLNCCFSCRECVALQPVQKCDKVCVCVQIAMPLLKCTLGPDLPIPATPSKSSNQSTPVGTSTPKAGTGLKYLPSFLDCSLKSIVLSCCVSC